MNGTNQGPLDRKVRRRAAGSLARVFALLAAAVVGSSPAVLAAGGPSISASLQPHEIAVGQVARLTVGIHEPGARPPGAPQLPGVDGLDILPAGQSRQVRIVNGVSEVTHQFNFHVRATEAGDFVIPPITVAADGAELKTEPLELRVVAAGSARPGAGTTRGAAAPAADLGEAAFLEIELAELAGREHLYVGEMVPIAIRAYFPEGVRINLESRPRVEGAGFTLRNLSERPEQGSTVRDGERYRVLTWYAGLAGVKSGDSTLSASLEVDIATPRAPARSRTARSPFGPGFDPFDDPFFDGLLDDFFATVEWRRAELASDPVTLEVAALPTDGRPAGFSGAVGTFTFGGFSVPAEASTGEPVELSVTVDGEGNFDRVEAPQVQPEDYWKTYPAKAANREGDMVGFAGSKTFRLTAVPLRPGEVETRFELAYFDPHEGSYKTIATDPVPVTLSGAAVADTAAPAAPVQEPQASETDGLAPMRTSIGEVSGAAIPLWRRGWFVGLQIGIAATLLVGAVASWALRRRLGGDWLRGARERRELAALRQRARDARLRQDAAGFFAAARELILNLFAARTGARRNDVSPDLVAQRLPGSNAARVLELAEAVHFSGVQPGGDSLDEWQSRLAAACEEIEASEALRQGGAQRGRARPHWGEVRHDEMDSTGFEPRTT